MNSQNIDWSELLEKAIKIAVSAHEGQRQKDGTPYILHPIHLMQQLSDPAARIAAVLHDVVEDTAVSLEELRSAGMPAEVMEALRLLTHEEGMPYADYIRRIAQNALARQVKMADLSHNMDVRRLPILTERDHDRLLKYHASWQLLAQHRE